MKTALERDVRLVHIEDGKLEIALEPNARRTLVNDLPRKLSEWTGRRWMVAVSAEAGAPTVQQQNAAQQNALEQDVRADPLVKAVLALHHRVLPPTIVRIRCPWWWSRRRRTSPRATSPP